MKSPNVKFVFYVLCIMFVFIVAAIRFPITTQVYFNHSRWIVNDSLTITNTASDTTAAGIDTVFVLPTASNGTGQFWAHNLDTVDTLGISFNGVSYSRIPPTAMVVFNPCNYAALSVRVFGAVAGDSVIVPTLYWTVYESER